MATIGEDYVSFEIARQLKEKGFNEQCFTYYDNTNDSINRFDKGYHFNNTSYPWGVPYNINNAKKYVCAPTLQMAMKWLREVYNFHIWVEHSHDKEGLYNAHVKVGWWSNNWAGVGYNTYEKAVEAAIEYCLKILI